MFKVFLTKQQLRVINLSLRKQQFQMLCDSFKKRKNSFTDLRNKSYSLFGIRPSIRTQDQKLYSDITQQLGKHENGKQFRVAEIENTADLNGSEEEEFLIQKIHDLKQKLSGQEDDIMKKLSTADSIKKIKNILLETDKSCLHKEHIVQSILLIWAFNKLNISIDKTNEQCNVDHILPLLKDHVPFLDVNELSTCYFYLRKMGVENSNKVLEQILIRALDEVEMSSETIALPALSHLVVGINMSKDFFTPMICAHFLKHLKRHIELCKSEEDARFIAICLSNLRIIVSNEMIELFKQKVSDLITLGQISSATTRTVIKILNLLNMPAWSYQHVPLIRQLLLTQATCLKQLAENDLKNICHIYQYHMEPASLHIPLAECVEGILNNKVTPDILACFVPFAQPERKETLINAFKALISSAQCWQTQNAAAYLFSTLRGLKISDAKICDAYWNGVLAKLETTPEEEIQAHCLRNCHRYMNFNNNLGGTYRHLELEKKLSQICMRAIEHDLAGRIPHKFARLASFVLAYGHTPYSWKKYPNILLSKIITMGEQFSALDCFYISRGLQISLEMRYRHQMPQLVGMQLSIIDSILTACTERHLNEELTVTDLNMLVRTLSNRKSLKNSVIYHKTLQKYKDIQCKDLSSRTIKDISYNFLATNYVVPEILEKMFSYIESNHEYVAGETVEKVLSCTYNLGYVPQSYDGLHYAGQILLRDFDYMSGLSLVQASLALCFYKTIPEELINKVFCVKFIQRVEEEIHMCYSKATYPERVFNTVMQLNRSVCLDFPEANVPWFQQNFIEAQLSKKPIFETYFSRSVKSLLVGLLKKESYIRCNHTTPYGYQIDFVINFDKNKNPIEAPVETTMLDRITKVAILLLKLDSFCENDLKALKGPESLKIKHLEMMGYKVLHINEHDWNSKYMNAPGAKRNYLKCLLQIST